MASVSLQSFLIHLARTERVPTVCAVTALDEADAVTLVRDAYGTDADPVSIEALPPVTIQERIGPFDFGVPVVRGIWYPHINNP